MKHIYIIAEIGCNHCGDPNLAKRMVDEAKACGVDAVKFQTFKSFRVDFEIRSES